MPRRRRRTRRTRSAFTQERSGYLAGGFAFRRALADEYGEDAMRADWREHREAIEAVAARLGRLRPACWWRLERQRRPPLAGGAEAAALAELGELTEADTKALARAHGLTLEEAQGQTLRT